MRWEWPCEGVTLTLVRLSYSDVLVVERDPTWRSSAELALREAGATTHWTGSLRGVQRAISSQAFDVALVDLDLFKPRERLEVVETLTHGSPAPVILAWAEEVSVQEAFELGRLGVREFRRARPSPGRLVPLITRVLATRPVLEPRLRAMVGHATQSEMMKIVRKVLLDQALGAPRGNKTKAGELLRISRQAVADRVRPIEEAS